MAKKQPKTHRVYCTYFPDGRYYIGYSCKTDKQFEKYFGSSSLVKNYLQENARHVGQPVDEILDKEVIAEYPSRAPAKIQEFLLQWQQRNDPNCVNDMLHVRLRASHLKEFKEIEWSPNVRN
jgi:hypothetical protein